MGGESVTVDYSCDNGRLFCVLGMVKKNCPYLQERKQMGTKKNKNSPFEFLQSLGFFM